MRILLISNLYPPYTRGGAEQVVVRSVQGLKERGHEVSVITARPRKINRDRVSVFTEARSLWIAPTDEDGVRVYRFFPLNLFFYAHDGQYPAFVRFFWHLFDVFNLHSAFVVRRIIAEVRPDVIHTHNLKGIGYLIPWIIRHSGIRHVHTLHDVQLITPSSIIYPKLDIGNWMLDIGVKWYSRICRFLFGSPQVVISPSRFLHDFYRARGFFPKSQWVILPNPVVLDVSNSKLDPVIRQVAPSYDRDEIRNSNCTDTPFRFLYVGQIESHKGIEFLVQTFVHLSADVSSVELHIVGDGSQLAKIKSLAQNTPAIIFHGRLSREKAQEMYGGADVTIVPSLCYENSPSVIFESFAAGVPVIASHIEGVAELIRDGENGFTFAAGDREELIERMRWCVQYRSDLPRLGMVARESLKEFDIAPFLEKLLRLYQIQ